MKSNWKSKHFEFKELACKKTGEAKFGGDFISALDALREVYGKQMIVNSCARSKIHNDEIEGSSKHSMHVYDFPYHNTGGCIAIDIAMTDAVDRAKLIKLALATDWTVGISKTFLHLDRRATVLKMKQLVFLY